MISHEWHERDEAAGERRYYRAEKFGRKWRVITTLKSEPDWSEQNPVPREVLEELRGILMGKYQRRRVPWEDVVDVDKLVVAAGGESALQETAPR